jgi:uncharacterized protein (DUF1800 family)
MSGTTEVGATVVDEGGETRARQVPPVGSVGGTPTDPTPPGTPPAPALAPGLALATAVVLAACGGGGGEAGPTAVLGTTQGSGGSPGTAPGTAPAPAASPAPGAPASAPGPAPSPAPSPAPGAPPFGLAAASRLLAQASFGATKGEIVRAQSMGAAAWIDEQLAMPRAQGHVAWLRAQGYDDVAFQNSSTAANYTAWRAFLSRPDQLRQRMVYALSQILVVAIPNVTTPWPAFGSAYYLDVLDEHAFGSFRALLDAVTLSPAMGVYLSMRGSQRADSSGRQPDENYAREIMQLFTIGLQALNPDGTPRTAGGAPVETYDADDVTGLARVFTGWDYVSGAGINDTTPVRAITPMQHIASRHETGAKAFLDVNIPAGTSGPASLARALDALVAHPNVGPFLCRQLIQRLVGANPSPAYVARVAAVFADNGARVRGDLRAVLRAVLLDIEAQTPGTAAGAGKLREPVLRFTHWARAFGVSSPSGRWTLGSLADPATRLGQSPLQSSSVFNFYRPGYLPPGTSLAANGLVSPEMQIATETSVAGYLNCMQTAISAATGILGSDLVVDPSPFLALAANPQALVDELNLVLAAQQLSPTTLATLVGAIGAMPATTDAQRLSRVRAATLLVLACPEYLVQK